MAVPPMGIVPEVMLMVPGHMIPHGEAAQHTAQQPQGRASAQRRQQ